MILEAEEEEEKNNVFFSGWMKIALKEEMEGM